MIKINGKKCQKRGIMTQNNNLCTRGGIGRRKCGQFSLVARHCLPEAYRRPEESETRIAGSNPAGRIIFKGG